MATSIPVRLEDDVGFTDEHLIPLVDDELGNSIYLADLDDDRALAVDTSRDLLALRRAADRRVSTGGTDDRTKAADPSLENGT
ncbi:hypothetical protein [Streptomyces aureus]|uniref:hypothetical protein n=1 Tax=Streptomyces aureus TaxID=193461 RepID=UPI000569AD4E|nr:hypothetical protein [Streptomyces aureus]